MIQYEGRFRDNLTRGTVFVEGLATDANTKALVVVVRTAKGLEIFRPSHFEEPCRVPDRENGGFRDAPRFEACKEG